MRLRPESGMLGDLIERDMGYGKAAGRLDQRTRLGVP
jgi:hypothetical protein